MYIRRRLSKCLTAKGSLIYIIMSLCMTKPTKWRAPSEYSDQPEHPPSLIRVFAVRLKKALVLGYHLSAQRRLWSDWADAGRTGHFVGFFMRRLIYEPRHNKTCLRGLRPVKTQTGLLSPDWLGSWNFSYCTIQTANNKSGDHTVRMRMLIQCLKLALAR